MSFENRQFNTLWPTALNVCSFIKFIDFAELNLFSKLNYRLSIYQSFIAKIRIPSLNRGGYLSECMFLHSVVWILSKFIIIAKVEHSDFAVYISIDFSNLILTSIKKCHPIKYSRHLLNPHLLFHKTNL